MNLLGRSKSQVEGDLDQPAAQAADSALNGTAEQAAPPSDQTAERDIPSEPAPPEPAVREASPEDEKHADNQAELERRLASLVDAQNGVRAQQQAEAEKQIAEALAVLAEARAERERERERRAELEQRLAATADAAAASQRALDTVAATLSETRDAAARREAELTDAREQVLEDAERIESGLRADLHAIISDAEAAAGEAEAARDALEQQLSAANEVARERAAQVAEAQGELDAREQALGARDEQIRTAEAALAELRQELEAVMADRDGATTRVADLEARAETAEVTVSERDEAIAEMQVSATALEESLTTKRDELAAERQRFERALESERGRVAQLDARLAEVTADLEGQLAAANAVIDERDEALAAMRVQAAEAEESLATLRAELADERARFDREIEIERGRTTEAAQRLEATTSAASQRLEAATSAAARRLEEAATAAAEELEATKATAAQQLEAATSAAAAANNRASELEGRIAGETERHEQAAVEAANAAATLAEREREIAGLRSHAEASSRRIAELDERMEQLTVSERDAREAVEKATTDLEHRAGELAQAVEALEQARAGHREETAARIESAAEIQRLRMLLERGEDEVNAAEARLEAVIAERVDALLQQERELAAKTERQEQEIEHRRNEFNAEVERKSAEFVAEMERKQAAFGEEMERRSAEMLDSIKGKSDELAELERQIGTARQTLAEANAATERERARRAALEERLQAVAAITQAATEEAAAPEPEDEPEPEDIDLSELDLVAVEGRLDEDEETSPPSELEAETGTEPVSNADSRESEERSVDETAAGPRPDSDDAAMGDLPEVVAARVAPPAHDDSTRVSPIPDATMPQRRSRIFRRKNGGEPFIDRPGRCVVCSTEWFAGNREDLDRSGWIVRNDAAVCPTCQWDGWEYPEGAPLPIRSGQPGHAQ